MSFMPPYVICTNKGILCQNNTIDNLKYKSEEEALSKRKSRIIFNSAKYIQEWCEIKSPVSFDIVILEELIGMQEEFVSVDWLRRSYVGRELKEEIDEYDGVRDYKYVSDAYEYYLLYNFNNYFGDD
mgnify:CR=1 FL=1